jgi:hypothetical protein
MQLRMLPEQTKADDDACPSTGVHVASGRASGGISSRCREALFSAFSDKREWTTRESEGMEGEGGLERQKGGGKEEVSGTDPTSLQRIENSVVLRLRLRRISSGSGLVEVLAEEDGAAVVSSYGISSSSEGRKEEGGRRKGEGKTNRMKLSRSSFSLVCLVAAPRQQR